MKLKRNYYKIVPSDEIGYWFVYEYSFYFFRELVFPFFLSKNIFHPYFKTKESARTWIAIDKKRYIKKQKNNMKLEKIKMKKWLKQKCEVIE